MSHGRMYFRTVFILAIFLTAFSGLARGCAAGSATSATCTNNTAITAADSSQGSPYPSTINITGLTGNVTNVTLSLNGVTSANNLAGVQLLLLAPNGTKLVFLAGDALGDGGTAIVNGTITINDASGGTSFCGGD